MYYYINYIQGVHHCRHKQTTWWPESEWMHAIMIKACIIVLDQHSYVMMSNNNLPCKVQEIPCHSVVQELTPSSFPFSISSSFSLPSTPPAHSSSSPSRILFPPSHPLWSGSRTTGTMCSLGLVSQVSSHHHTTASPKVHGFVYRKCWGTLWFVG